MGLRSIAKTAAVKLAAKKFLQEVPVMGKLFNWLNDPKGVARKRTVAAIAAVIAAGLRGIQESFKAACDAGDFLASVCKLDPGVIASVADQVVLFLNTILVPGADFVAVVMAMWGLWASRGKKAVVVSS